MFNHTRRERKKMNSSSFCCINNNNNRRNPKRNEFSYFWSNLCYIVEVGKLFEYFALELVWICDLMMSNNLGWCCFCNENKLEVEKDFQGMKILVQNFSYKEWAIVIVDFEPSNKIIGSWFLHKSCISMFWPFKEINHAQNWDLQL
jgi:hypothetical protein